MKEYNVQLIGDCFDKIEFNNTTNRRLHFDRKEYNNISANKELL